MTAEPGTIDLGVIVPEGDEIDSPWPAWVRLRRWARHRTPWTVTVVMVLLAATMAGAAPQPPWLRPHLTLPAGGPEPSFHLAGDTLYIVHDGDTGHMLAAYRLTDGALRWQVSGGYFTYLEPGAPMLLSYEIDEAEPELPVPWTAMLDPDTGQERWATTGNPIAIIDEQVLLHRVPPEPAPADQPAFGPPEEDLLVAAVDRQTGAEMWTLPEMRLWTYVYDAHHEPRWLAALDRNDQLTTYHLITGAPLATTAVEAPRPGQLYTAGDLVILQPDLAVATFVAYDAVSLAQRWTVTLPTVPFYLTDCGALICASSAAPPQALDPATGQVVWTADWFPDSDGYHLPSLGPLWPSGYLLVNDWLVDGATGDPVLDLAGWHRAYPATGEPLVTRYERGERRTWFGRLTADPPGIAVLGAVDSRLTGCSIDDRHVVCADHEEVRVYRIR